MWGEEDSIKRPEEKHIPWQFVQGKGAVSGRLIGGCLDSLGKMIWGTSLWPDPREFENAVLFLETSEEMPSPDFVLHWLRNLGAQGVLGRLAGILFARPGGEFRPESRAEKERHIANYPRYDEALLKAAKEFGRTDMPIVTHMDFGHTIPQTILPYGALCRMDMDARKVFIDDNAVVD
jgi:muramoyltetrapeptide carboxypeptidase LdcA involved in peptidoglycan recycling